MLCRKNVKNHGRYPHDQGQQDAEDLDTPILYGTYPMYWAAIRAADLRQIWASADDFGLMTYDPGFVNTASPRGRVTFVDRERGILRSCLKEILRFA
jgi:hypothetical protein